MKIAPLAHVTGIGGMYRVVFRATVVRPMELSAQAEFAPMVDGHIFTRYRAAQNLANAINATARGRVCK